MAWRLGNDTSGGVDLACSNPRLVVEWNALNGVL